MSADEMFKKLGYIKVEDDNRIEYYNEIRYSPSQFICERYYIEFNKNIKMITSYIDDGGDSPMPITIDELKAINKKVEELGWQN